MLDKIFGAKEHTVDEILKLSERAIRAVENKKSNPIQFMENNSTPKLTVETIDNHVYFYATVDSDRCLAMIRTIRELDSQLRRERLSRNIPEHIDQTPIWLHIQSGGGELFPGLATADQLAVIQTPIYSIIEGVCASAATLISLACSKRYITASSFMLIHQFSAVHWGTHESFKDEMELQNMLIGLLVNYYQSKSKIPKSNIKKMLKHDTWMNADKCLELGLVDAIWNQ
jgi:ATP-dependent protease ClpP protease subunit